MSQLNTGITNNECKEPSDIENSTSTTTAYKERATIATAVPTNSIVYIDGRPYQEIQPSQPQVFVISRDIDYNNNNQRGNLDNDPRLPCTIMGFCFSWIPLVGFMTYLCNLDAPSDSLRARYARGACMVAVFVIIFNLFFWTLYRVS